MSISLDSIFAKMSEGVGNVEDELNSFMQSMDPNNPADMLKLQQLTTKWSMITNLSTNMMSNVKEATKSVVSNMR